LLAKRIIQPELGSDELKFGKDDKLAVKNVSSKQNGEFHIILDAPVKNLENNSFVRMCDYASAGHTWAKDSLMRVWLPQPLNLSNPLEDIPAPKLQFK